jgi:hypothetical protein
MQRFRLSERFFLRPHQYLGEFVQGVGRVSINRNDFWTRERFRCFFGLFAKQASNHCPNRGRELVSLA